MAKVLIDAGYTVEVSYNLAPKQPDDINLPDGIQRTVQYSSLLDVVAPQSEIQNIDERRTDVVPLKKKLAPTTGGGHTIDSYHQDENSNPDKDTEGVFKIKSGERGAVEKRKTNEDSYHVWIWSFARVFLYK